MHWAKTLRLRKRRENRDSWQTVFHIFLIKQNTIKNELFFHVFQTVEVQSILVTSFIDTYVLTTYQDRSMHWNVLVNAASLPHYPVRIGYLAFNGAVRHYNEYQYSFTSDYSNLDKIQKIDQETQTGASNAGEFYYVLDDNNENSFTNPGYKCRRWVDEDRAFDVTSGTTIDFTLAASCMVSLNHGQLYSYNKYINSNIPSGYTCYTLKKAKKFSHSSDSSLNQVQTPRCCYDSDNALVTEPALIKGLNLYQRFASTLKHNEEFEMYQHCCSKANIQAGTSTVDLCTAFKGRRPVASSTNSVKRAGGE